MTESQLLALIGLCSGITLGLGARLGRFCSLGAIEDIVYGGRYYRALMWPVAIGWAMLFLALAIWFGYFEIEAATYLQFKPNYLAHIIGGLTFGYGMALAGMCGFTGLARIGSGDLRALYVVIIIGIASYIAANGPLAQLRQKYLPFEPLATGDITPSFLPILSKGTNVPIAGLLALFGLALISLPMLRSNFRKSNYQFWAMLIGAGIAIGWVGTMSVSLISFVPITVQSHTFSMPLGDSLLYLMTSSGSTLKFGIGSVLGVILGGTLGSLIKNDFTWEACDDTRELRRIIFGAVLMGIGAVVAFGCSIGQGISAMALLSFGAPVTLAAIVLGAYIGLKYLIEG